MERGIVSMRVGFVLRSAEIQPLVPAICYCESGLDRLCALFKSRAARLFRDPFALPPTLTQQHTQPKRKLPHPSMGPFEPNKMIHAVSCGFILSTLHLPIQGHLALLPNDVTSRAHSLRVYFVHPVHP